SGGGANEEWQAVLPNPGVGTYLFAFRFTHGTGPWSYCDADGLATGGFTEAQAGQLSVQVPSVERCVLQFPPTLTSREGRQSELVYGRVYAPGITDGAGAGAGIEAELGVGASNQQPSDAGWQWTPGAFNVDVVQNGDEFQARLVGPTPGTYAYAYRARVSGGPWLLCDLDDSTNGFQLAQAGVLTALPFAIDECVLEAPLSAVSLPNTQTASFSARVRVPSLTEDAGAGPGLTGELGIGAIGTPPSTWTNWTSATFDGDAQGFDRSRALADAPAGEGLYEVAYRFKLGSGAYVYCDGDGLTNGYASSAAGRLSVNARLISACKLESVSAFSIASGQPLSATLSVLATGSGDAGVTPGLIAHVGVGPQNDDASNSPLWGWAAATYDGEFDGGRDGFTWLSFPAYSGQRAVAGRASVDNGQTWTYCDFVGGDAGFQVSAQYNVQVGASTDFAYCNTQFPTTISPDAGVTRFYGQVYESGLTPNAAAPIRAEFGLGFERNDPGVAWSWLPAPIAAVATLAPNNNEYAIDLAPDAGASHYAFRFSRNDGGSWCYGDLNGNGTSVDGFSGFVSGAPNLGRVIP
ncbi:MAG: hypothetical protein JNG84_08070, partial [Archangium sp.]|nr:hypothetical protein [Archangium sp.]